MIIAVQNNLDMLFASLEVPTEQLTANFDFCMHQIPKKHDFQHKSGTKRQKSHALKNSSTEKNPLKFFDLRSI